jgi:hypothetical protein
MSDHKQTKIALDENRMSILGVQILYGFQLHAPFQTQFETLPAASKDASLAAFFLMTVAIVLLIAPSAYHRIAVGGQSTAAVRTAVTWVNNCALVLLAAAIGLDLFLVGERIAGARIGFGLGIAFALCAFVFWFGIELMHRTPRQNIRLERAPQDGPKLSERIDFVLTEARVVLPGVQALLGFQLIVVLTDEFTKLPSGPVIVHLLALFAVAVSAVLLIAPAAHHRIVYRGADSEDFPAIASTYLLAATVFLALGMAGDCYVIVLKVVESDAWAIAAAVTAAMLCLAFWHLLPLIARYYHHRHQSKRLDAVAGSSTPGGRQASG